MQGEVFIDQITGDIYVYDKANELFTSMGYINQDMASDLQKILKDKNKKMVKSHHSILGIPNSHKFTYAIY